MYKILIVEDEVKLRDELKLFLINSGYEVDVLDDFSNTIESIKKSLCDLVLLDVNIPYINGEIVCKEVRKDCNIPIIIVTSRNNEIDELLSINYGADDFVTKPYNTQILLARIERLLKRNNGNNNIYYEDMLLDSAKCIISKDDKYLDLSKNEFKILFYLINNRGKIVSRDDLINYLWDSDEFIDDNTLTVNINRLRNKLDDFGYIDIIKTKRGLGYIIL